jgi:hypothetical protein
VKSIFQDELSDFDGGNTRISCVYATVPCTECGKRRVIYSGSKLTSAEQRLILRVEEELLYVCGSPLFPGGDHQDRIIVREALSCASPIETAYYAGKYFCCEYLLNSTWCFTLIWHGIIVQISSRLLCISF